MPATLLRGLHGIFHSVSKTHLHRYLSESQFRWNTRQDRDSERMAKAVKASVGKRLRYASQLGGWRPPGPPCFACSSRSRRSALPLNL